MTILSKTIKANMENRGFTFSKRERRNEALRFKAKLLNAADAQLNLLDKMNSIDELDYPSKGNNGKYWWSGKAYDNKRLIRIYQASRLVDPNMDDIDAENSIAAVRQTISEIRAQIASTNDDDWLDIEKERAAQQQKSAGKAKERRAKKQ